MKKRLKSLAVIALTITLLGLVLYQVGLEELFNTLRQANPFFIGLAFLVFFFQIWISALKWEVLLKSRGYDVSFVYLFKLYLVGLFFNNFLPSNVGGDVVRVYELGKRIQNNADALASVFVERFTGFIMMIVFACLALLTNLALVENTVLTLAIIVASVGLMGILWVVLDARLLNFVENRIKIGIVQKVTGKFRQFQKALYAYGEDRRTLVNVFVLSTAFYFISMAYIYVAALAFHQPVDFLDIAIITPIILLVSTLPLTFNGIGLQEWVYVLMFAWIGLPEAVGLSTIVVIRAAALLWAIIGGVIYPSVRSGDASESAIANSQVATPLE